MKLLLVLGSDDNYALIAKSLIPLGCELIRYRHVLKAMDNLDEINPDAIIVSARDFPRHWKILVQFVRNEHSKEMCPIIILKGPNFTAEETSKAFFLGVSGVVDDALDKPQEMDRLQNILGRYTSIEEKRKNQRYIVEPCHRISFLAVNLSGKSIIKGDVKTISCSGLSFMPYPHLELNEQALTKEYNECSLRIGDAIISPICRLVRIHEPVSMEFMHLKNNEKQMLDRFMEEFPLLESR
ncbi:MAG: PilZ domain-containing protein [Treponema sp.]|nr:PilZ domain-containing protein [Treponema sp.]